MEKTVHIEKRYFASPIPWLSSREVLECVVCAEEIQIHAIYNCGHTCCYLCALRMKKSGEFDCPICRSRSDSVHLSLSPSTKEAKNVLTRFFNKTMGFSYNDKCIIEAVDSLDAFRCPYESCWCFSEYHFQNLPDLSHHLKKMHLKVYCDICMKGKRNFLLQQSHYPEDGLDLHVLGKHPSDPSTFLGHILCYFCKTYQYDMDQFMQHMREKHFACDLCSSVSPNRFFSDRQKLYSHFRRSHFVCQHPACSKTDMLTKTFSSEIDLQAHSVKEHGSRSIKKMPLKLQSLGFSFTKTQNSSIESAFGSFSIEERRANILIFDFLSFQKEHNLTKFNYTNVNSHPTSETDTRQANARVVGHAQLSGFHDQISGVVSRYKKIVMSGTRQQGNTTSEQKNFSISLANRSEKWIPKTEVKPLTETKLSGKSEEKMGRESYPTLHDAYKVPKRKSFVAKGKKKKNAWCADILS